MSFISQFFNASMKSVKLIGQIDEFKGVWSLLGNTVTDHYLRLQRESTVQGIGSSMRLAGISIQDQEINTLLNLQHPISYPSRAPLTKKTRGNPTHSEELNSIHLKSPSDDQPIDKTQLVQVSEFGEKTDPEEPIKRFYSAEENEALGYFEALNLAWEFAKGPTLSLDQILALHQKLMSHSPKDGWHSGKFKISANSWKLMGNKELPRYFETTSTDETPLRMGNLVNWLNVELEQQRTHPLILTAVFTMTFLEIHPFQDGNGRMARILTKLLAWQGGYLHTRYSSLDPILESERPEYFINVEQTLLTLQRDVPDWEAWLQFLLGAFLKETQQLSAQLSGERKNFSPLPQLAAQIMDMARAQGRLSIGDVIKATGGNRNTLKLHFKTLVTKGMLIKEGLGAGVWYHLS